MELLTHNPVFRRSMVAQPWEWLDLLIKTFRVLGLNFLIIHTKAAFTYLINNENSKRKAYY